VSIYNYCVLASLGYSAALPHFLACGSPLHDGVSDKQLRDTEKLWFSSDNVKKANECIVEFIQGLRLPTIFNDKDDILHTSSDGKKVVVAVNSLLANYSYKYYGKEKGISVNSFVDEKQSFFHVNILTSSDREAPYMMDGLAKSKASVFRHTNLRERTSKKHIHSTDTHGYTEAIFAGLHFLDVSFAPRIAKVNKQTLYAYEAKSLQKNSNYFIAPNSVINKKLILDNWDDILRLMASIKLNYCSASQMFKMLSASAKDSELYRAMKEFGRLIKSKFILSYINDSDLRKAITKQLNRAELGQKLSEAIFFGRKGQLHVGTPEEMQCVMTCKTLLKNTIILWNYLFLSDYCCSSESNEEKQQIVESISSGSVISWRHINMHGVYDFDQKYIRSFKSTLKQMQNVRISF
jgi:TnpA family transposase